MMTKKLIIIFFLIAVVFSLNSIAQNIQPIIVTVDKPKAEIKPEMWGIFFEDINFGADGGIYAEMIKNRSFEFAKPRTGWQVNLTSRDSSHFVIQNRGNLNQDNPRYVRISIKDGTRKNFISNSGFRGMGIKQNNKYNFSIMASLPDESNIKLRIELISQKGEKIGEALIPIKGKDWKKYEIGFVATATDLKASLKISFEGTGVIDIDMVSLFPGDTWKGRPYGLRADIVQLLADLKPGFLRFPGGCIVEGYDLSLRYQWKKTIGNIEDRKTIINRWNTEFAHRLTPDYYQSFGLGFFEYFQLAEDIGAEPLPILNCGMACQFNSAEVVPLVQLDPYIQDAIDLIEFANGPADSKWGKIRAQMGHPAPFNMKMLGIGNEQWGPQYFERYNLFEKTIKAKYPNITLVSGSGPQPDDELFKFAVGELKKTNANIVDEHYYRPPVWFRDNAARYDNYDRNSYKIFAGEYAAQSVFTCSPDNKNNWDCALSEAAFMTGLERNADVVNMCSYAPLLAHVDGWQWTPDLIWFNNLTSYGSTNYYVQKLFSTNKGTHVLNMLQENKPLTGQQGLYATAAIDKQLNEIILKLVNTTPNTQVRSIVLQTSRKILPDALITILKNESLAGTNSIENPDAIKPADSKIKLKGKNVTLSLTPYSLTVVRIKVQ
ncbi:MAG TPA: alpha-L-arabinofuranosidase C-terminal domain-containing protein [Bacteroidales bacterium]